MLDLIALTGLLEIVSKLPVFIALLAVTKTGQRLEYSWRRGLLVLCLGTWISTALSLGSDTLTSGFDIFSDSWVLVLALRGTVLNLVAIIIWWYLSAQRRWSGFGSDLIMSLVMGSLIGGSQGWLQQGVSPAVGTKMVIVILLFGLVLPLYRSIIWQIRRAITVFVLAAGIVVGFAIMMLGIQAGLLSF